MPRLSAANLEARRLAAAAVPECIEKLVEIVRNGPNTAKLNAIQQLLDRALGKPENKAEIEHIEPDEDRSRAFAPALIKAYPELAEAVFSGKPLPEPAVVDVPALPEGSQP